MYRKWMIGLNADYSSRAIAATQPYFDRQHQPTRQQRLVKKLEAMGLKVTVEALPEAA